MVFVVWVVGSLGLVCRLGREMIVGERRVRAEQGWKHGKRGMSKLEMERRRGGMHN